jgi:nicotinate-nucleotide pyrophosphorylase (carboxylating)
MPHALKLGGQQTIFLHFQVKLFHPCLVEPLSKDEICRVVRAALAEDIGPGDVTTLAIVPEHLAATAVLAAREELVLAGLSLAEATFRELCSTVQIEPCASDGQCVAAGQIILRLHGPARVLLTAERVALNFLQRLSGIATLTAQYVEAVKGTQARILDTRKTTPGWRRLEKYAVTCGRGQNHRQGLFDLVLIKDNHLAALRHELPNPIAAAVARARAACPGLEVGVEADTLEQVRQAVEAGADIILLDNMSPAQLREAVQLVGGRAKTEASGGVNLSTVRPIAESGVDMISVGALTHSARAVDLALDFETGNAEWTIGEWQAT